MLSILRLPTEYGEFSLLRRLCARFCDENALRDALVLLVVNQRLVNKPHVDLNVGLSGTATAMDALAGDLSFAMGPNDVEHALESLQNRRLIRVVGKNDGFGPRVVLIELLRDGLDELGVATCYTPVGEEWNGAIGSSGVSSDNPYQRDPQAVESEFKLPPGIEI